MRLRRRFGLIDGARTCCSSCFSRRDTIASPRGCGSRKIFAMKRGMLLLFLALAPFAQTGKQPKPPTNADVVEMWRVGVPESTIILASHNDSNSGRIVGNQDFTPVLG